MQPFEHFWKPIGSLILAFAEIEKLAFIYLLQQSGMPFDAGRSFFSNEARIQKAIKAIKKQAALKNIDSTELNNVFSQTANIARIRNDICHCSKTSNGDQLVINNRIWSASSREYGITVGDIDDMIADLEHINSWIHVKMLDHVGSGEHADIYRAASQGAWRYKSKQQAAKRPRSASERVVRPRGDA